MRKAYEKGILREFSKKFANFYSNSAFLKENFAKIVLLNFKGSANAKDEECQKRSQTL